MKNIPLSFALLKNDPGAFDNQNHGLADKDLQFVSGILVACNDKR
jgi:hypothetical protein|tara:strand:+ start:7050 stop:7184 length:135 start_codon:yes stop_codon:yes gene_type:complete